jgi:hypothetical protein
MRIAEPDRREIYGSVSRRSECYMTFEGIRKILVATKTARAEWCSATSGGSDEE